MEKERKNDDLQGKKVGDNVEEERRKTGKVQLRNGKGDKGEDKKNVKKEDESEEKEKEIKLKKKQRYRKGESKK